MHVLLGKAFNLLSDAQAANSVDIKWAMFLRVYSIQQHGFHDVLMAIKEKCWKQKLGLKVDKLGLIRCHGRFLNADITENAKLFPRQEHVTKLKAQILEEYWIPQGRVEVRSVLSKCVVSQKQEGHSFRLSESPALLPFSLLAWTTWDQCM